MSKTSESPLPVKPEPRVLVMFPFFNEGEKLQALAAKFRPLPGCEVVAVNDGSTDQGPEVLRAAGIRVFDQSRSGIGAAVKRCVRYGLEEEFEILVVMAGNGKDDPTEIPRLLVPITEHGADYVQGSRFLDGGSSLYLPRFRRLAIKLLSFIFSLYARQPCTDLTNGFRAYKLSLFEDPKIDIWQDWLDTYEYEYYVHFKVYQLGYQVAEAAVSKTYPSDPGVSYSKIRPFFDWWRMLRPLVFLALRIKH